MISLRKNWVSYLLLYRFFLLGYHVQIIFN
ncbi:hypothetical protein CY0110_18777 [Crocosphaera chwakensis CCY0110]|uniref:Uncharacterized protein n=1 Tax=Crocosphaera chwakensis CCY0110 TaxID=391612 RepID=A3IJ87_9CHRO|nr:hypothetical protein CY0110_18777 [Crocosphaera chwakensis CCY0110]